jgi:Tol biopolymer transport system component
LKSIPLQILRFSFIASALCIVLLLLSLLLGQAMPTERLLFLSTRDGISKLHALDIQSGLTHKLNDTELLSYAMSPDGRQILYTHENDGGTTTFTMSTSGDDVYQLVDLPSVSPAWSPDSQYIAFSMFDEQSISMQIHSVKRDGTALKVLTNLPVSEGPFSPSWSPDGTRILFQSTAGGNKLNTYFMNADGSELKQLTLPDGFTGFAYTPQWSPDNDYLAFLGQIIDDQDQVIDTSLCVLELTTDDLHCLDTGIFFDFAWSPDSKQIAYVTSGWSGIFNLEILNLESGEIQRILRYSETTPVQVNNLNSPMWTPDGNALIYELSIRDNRNASQLYIVNADGSSERRLTDGVSVNYMASWWANE